MTRLEQPLGGQFLLQLFKRQLQRPHTNRNELVDRQLITAPRGINVDRSATEDLDPLLQFELQSLGSASPNHCREPRVVIFQREVTMTRTCPSQVANLAAHGNPAELPAQRRLDLFGQLTDGQRCFVRRHVADKVRNRWKFRRRREDGRPRQSKRTGRLRRPAVCGSQFSGCTEPWREPTAGQAAERAHAIALSSWKFLGQSQVSLTRGFSRYSKTSRHTRGHVVKPAENDDNLSSSIRSGPNRLRTSILLGGISASRPLRTEFLHAPTFLISVP